MNITGSEKFEKFCKKYNDAQPALEACGRKFESCHPDYR